MTTSPPPDRVTAIYDALDAFQREHRIGGGLGHAQIRALLAEHLDRALPAVVSAVAPDTDQTTPSRRAGLHNELTRAIHHYDYDHMLSGNDIPSDHHRGEADAVLAVLYREWPWLRAEAEEAATDQTALRERIAGARQRLFGVRWADAEQFGAALDAYHDAVLAVLPASADRAAGPLCVCGHPMQQHFEDVCLTNCGCNDGIEAEAADLPDRLAAVLTARFTELGNPFSRMVVHEQGPDGWPATHPVGPNRVAEVLRELMAEPPAGGAQQPKEEA